ncbi:MAG TPA: hypothetical protein VLH08_11790 [Acidobacteriota bacterium]|nr:hypothetical protein [Acidobacteriota bacterium]
MRVSSILIIVFSLVCSICGAENILLSAATSDKKLILLNIQYSNKKYKVVDQAIFDVPFQAGNTAIGHLRNGNYQVVWTAQDASNKIKLNSMIFDSNLNKVGNTKKFGPVLSSHFNMNIVDVNEQTLQPSDSNEAAVEDSFHSYAGFPEFVFVTGRNELTGAPLSKRKKLFSNPPGFRPDVTKFVCPSELAERNCYYASLGSVNQDRRGVLFGNADNPNYTTAYIFTNNVSSGDLLPIVGTDNFNFIHSEYGNNNFRIMNRQFNGHTGQPAGNLKVLTPWYANQSNFASLPRFGSLSSASNFAFADGHVMFIKPKVNVTEIWAFSLDTQNGQRNSSIQKMTFGYEALLYGMDTTAVLIP